jgi:hypothetical protein
VTVILFQKVCRFHIIVKVIVLHLAAMQVFLCYVGCPSYAMLCEDASQYYSVASRQFLVMLNSFKCFAIRANPVTLLLHARFRTIL